jgi:ribosomal protein L21
MIIQNRFNIGDVVYTGIVYSKSKMVITGPLTVKGVQLTGTINENQKPKSVVVYNFTDGTTTHQNHCFASCREALDYCEDEIKGGQHVGVS